MLCALLPLLSFLFHSHTSEACGPYTYCVIWQPTRLQVLRVIIRSYIAIPANCTWHMVHVFGKQVGRRMLQTTASIRQNAISWKACIKWQVTLYSGPMNAEWLPYIACLVLASVLTAQSFPFRAWNDWLTDRHTTSEMQLSTWPWYHWINQPKTN